ncbi:MAG: hypothetical protein HWE26_21830 [Alteromonadaceae bacterium]|nr:hypothetical protein [Alteromonadaceae bacterium]
MKLLQHIYLPLLVSLVFAFLIGFFVLMYRWARKQKGAAMAFGMMVQMFLPDPKAQQTIEHVIEVKQKESKKSQQSQGDKK